jgi:hypothetical protein
MMFDRKKEVVQESFGEQQLAIPYTFLFPGSVR